MSMSDMFPRAYDHFRRRHCDRCFQPNSKLLCTGCKTAVYCSRECQKKAWRTEHRLMCAAQSNADRNIQANHLGYVSSLSLINVLDEWIEIRRWCLFTLMCALVQLAGGVDAVLEGTVGEIPTAQKALILHVIPEPRTAHGGNPALAFRLAHAAITDRESDDFLRANWKDIDSKARFASVPVIVLTKAIDSDTLAAPAGVLPAVYVVHGTDIYNPKVFTLFHLPLRHVGDAVTLKDAPDARTRAACEELVKIMKDIIHKPLVYMRPDDLKRPEPDWGVYRLTGTQKKRGWEWMELPVDAKSWTMWERLTDEMWPGRTSGLTPREVLTLFDYGNLLGHGVVPMSERGFRQLGWSVIRRVAYARVWTDSGNSGLGLGRA